MLMIQESEVTFEPGRKCIQPSPKLVKQYKYCVELSSVTQDLCTQRDLLRSFPAAGSLIVKTRKGGHGQAWLVKYSGQLAGGVIST